VRVVAHILEFLAGALISYAAFRVSETLGIFVLGIFALLAALSAFQEAQKK